MDSNIMLESSSLFIRTSVFSDCFYFTEWEEKEYVKQFFTISDGRDYEEIVTEFIHRKIDDTKLQFTIVYKATNIPIGRIYISRIDKEYDSLDITRIYIGEEEFLSKGYGREALIAVLNYCFEEIKVERVTLDFFEENKRARNLYESVGFKPEGIMRNAGKKNGRYVNLHLMSILKEDYFKGIMRHIHI